MSGDDWTPIAPHQDYGEGIYSSRPLAMSWGGILAYTPDMYGGIGGQMMAQGGITGMPSPGDGGSGTVVPGIDGGSSTPSNRDNELLSPWGLPVPNWTPHGHSGAGGPDQLAAQVQHAIASAAGAAPRQVNSGLYGVPGFGWTDKWPAPQQASSSSQWMRLFKGSKSRGGLQNLLNKYGYDSGNPLYTNPLDESWPGEDYYWGASLASPYAGEGAQFPFLQEPGFYFDGTIPSPLPDWYLSGPRGDQNLGSPSIHMDKPWLDPSTSWSDVRPGHLSDPIELFWARRLLGLPD